MSEDQILWMAGMIITAFLCGIIVLIADSSYRFDQNLESNKQYFSSIEASPPGNSP